MEEFAEEPPSDWEGLFFFSIADKNKSHCDGSESIQRNFVKNPLQEE